MWIWKITVKTQSWNSDKNNLVRSWFSPKRYTNKSCCFYLENVPFTICVPFCRFTNSNKIKLIIPSIIASLIRFSLGMFFHNALLVRFGSIKSRKIDLQNFLPETSRNFHEKTILGKVGVKSGFEQKTQNISFPLKYRVIWWL